MAHGISAKVRRKGRQFFGILLQVYKLASSAVHGRDVKRSDKNEAFLENAQTFCRKGIMKRLREQENPQWNDIIMGDDG